ncbi:MAG: bifunctional hydroxymethylpyrimidine kinase/phosphomethylpyrimidine kinase [Pseudomonadota bacterium]|nr:bifunctional hydroxymethylpyrimidine kinase/phosphomethylpyrimidine kinase [Pseudomonadota bacterium]
MNTADPNPAVLVIAGHDPSGGAGIQADIEAIVSMGCHPATVVTTITAQDTVNAHAVYPLPVEQVIAQAEAVLADIPFSAVKIGLLGSADIARAIAKLLARHGDIPLVLDPVLIATGGAQLADTDVMPVLREALIPLATVVTPNVVEARALTDNRDDLAQCGRALLATGAEYALITGGDEPGPDVVNYLFGPDQTERVDRWPRLSGEFHGSGCTLASAVAGLLAQGHTTPAAVHQAQLYVWDALKTGYRPGHGHSIPNRLFWAADRR